MGKLALGAQENAIFVVGVDIAGVVGDAALKPAPGLLRIPSCQYSNARSSAAPESVGWASASACSSTSAACHSC